MYFVETGEGHHVHSQFPEISIEGAMAEWLNT